MSARARPIEGELLAVPLELLKPNPRNRSLDNDEDLGDLGMSMLRHGCLQPLLVEETTGGYRIIAGHRRAAAAKLVGLADLPCRIRKPSDTLTRQALAAIENLQRKQLTPMEEARALRELITLTRSQAAASRQIGRSPAWLANRLALLDLPEEAQQMVDSGQLGTVAATNLARQVRRTGHGTAPTGRGVNDTWFGPRHRLAVLARRRCEVAEHDDVKVGRVACGPCWEAVIVADSSLTGALDDDSSAEEARWQRIETVTVRDGLL